VYTGSNGISFIKKMSQDEISVSPEEAESTAIETKSGGGDNADAAGTC
jgi:hypothetical protein